jgi:RNA polymerase subunit RPABC4/transcription elongation factor Spt4
MDRSAIIGDIVDTWLRRGENRSTFAFCVNRKHAQHVAERFLEARVRAEYMDGETPLGERLAIFDRFRAGATRVVCNVGVLTTGVDEDVRCIIDAKPTKSPILFTQTIGRGLRTAEGKDHLLILDHAGNHLRLGMVTEVGSDRLDDGKERKSARERKERGEPLPKLCDECKAVVPPRATCCPQCGHLTRAWTTIEAVDGELVKIGDRAPGNGASIIADKAGFYGELRGHAKALGYADGWVAHKFREKFGHWPNDPRVRSAEARPPSLKTRNWIRSRQIAFAKARERAVG